jgi:hypothetical protein
MMRDFLSTRDRRTGMTARRDDLTGLDDFIAESALARRALLRHLADEASCVRSHPGLAHGPASATAAWVCGRCFEHPRRPTEFDALGYLLVDTCACIRASGHDHGCWCEHGMQRVVYRVDDDGREHYATLPLR